MMTATAIPTIRFQRTAMGVMQNLKIHRFSEDRWVVNLKGGCKSKKFCRGPVHTISFDSMGTVTNMSRDYIITKLDFRVRYDTDVDKVRKIIKKINMEIEKDPEMGPNLPNAK